MGQCFIMNDSVNKRTKSRHCYGDWAPAIPPRTPPGNEARRGQSYAGSDSREGRGEEPLRAASKPRERPAARTRRATVPHIARDVIRAGGRCASPARSQGLPGDGSRLGDMPDRPGPKDSAPTIRGQTRRGPRLASATRSVSAPAVRFAMSLSATRPVPL
jgi:hypothetical protein